MPTVLATVDKLGRKNLLQAVKLYDPNQEINMAREMAGNIVDTVQTFEEIAAYGGLSLPSKTTEYGNPPQTEYEQIYTAQYRNNKMMLQFRVSNEAFDDEQKGYGVVRAYGSDMASVFHQKMEIDAADTFMNLANDAVNNAGPDGVALGSASHPLEIGTESNILSPAETLAPQSVTKMFARLKKTKAHKGYLMPIVGPGVIECSAENELLARQIMNSVQQQGENSNSSNEIGKLISGVLANPYFTNQEWFAVRIANKRKHKRFVQIREGFNLTSWKYDEDTDSWKATARSRYVFGSMGFRGIVYSFAS